MMVDKTREVSLVGTVGTARGTGPGEDRRLAVLRAIVEDYVETREPVGSRTIVERHRLGVSPATIRNDMASLEDEGLIAQPHTSAGRIPTDKGYRLFVDRLSTIKPLSAAERRAVEHFLVGAADLDEVVGRAGQLLAQLTGQVAVVQYPSLRRSGLRHLELVPIGTDRLLVVIITDTGRVEQRTIEVDEVPAELELVRLRATLNVAAAGRRLPDLVGVFDDLEQTTSADRRGLLRQVADLVTSTLAEEREERIVLAGTSNLAHVDMRFEHALGPVLEALEEQVVLLQLLNEMATETGAVSIRIGHETRLDGLADASIVTSGYGQEGDSSVATVSSIGPTRMDYPATIAAVRAVARYLSRVVTP